VLLTFNLSFKFRFPCFDAWLSVYIVAEFMRESIASCSTCTMSSSKKFTFAISSADEILVAIGVTAEGLRANIVVFERGGSFSAKFTTISARIDISVNALQLCR